MTTPLQLNKIYTFNTLAPAILGAQIKNAKLLGIVDYSTALNYDNVDLRFRQIYPVLPANTPNQPTLCTYYRFQSESGEKIILADQWIDMNTVTVVEHVNLQVTFSNAKLEDVTTMRDALNALGFTNFEIKQV